MPCDFIAGEDYLLPTVALTEIVDMTSLVCFDSPTTDILFLYGQHSRSVGLEFRIHRFYLDGETKTVSAHPFRE